MGFNKVLHGTRKVITMNEQRYKVILNMAGNPKPRDEQDWEELIQGFRVLQNNVTVSVGRDILQEIIDTINSLQSNKPKPKVYRAKVKRLAELEALVMKNNSLHSR